MDLEQRLIEIRQRMEQAAKRAGRSVDEITLLAVSKGQPPSAIEAAVRLGLRHFAESKIQELKAKVGRTPSQISWQMIGHLQSNKGRDAVQFSRMIQSIDSLPLAQEVQKWCDKLGKSMPILLEVNVAGEGSKFGYSPERLLEDLPALALLPRLEIHGLMTIAPWTPDPSKVRPVFRRLAELKKECEQLLQFPLPQLSMGMSGDFEVAIEEGATFIRIGTALFGPRQAWKPASEVEAVDGP